MSRLLHEAREFHAILAQMMSANTGKFTPYPWQQTQMQHLLNAIEQQRLPHAILFSGPTGIGKRHLTDSLVYNALRKHSKSEKFETLLLAGTHPDVSRVSPLEDKKQISVDQIRALSERISLTPQISLIKIAVIYPAESLTVAAANALLKTLEEPAGNTLIILVSHNYGSLSQTIRSRCQHMPLGVPTAHEAEAWLESQGVSDYQRYLELTSGLPLAAYSAAENGWLEQYDQLMNDLSGLIERRLEKVTVSGKWRETDSALVISWIQRLVKALIKSRFGDETTSNITANFLKNLKISLDRIDLRKLIDYSDYLDKTALEINYNLNREMFLEQIFSRWIVLSPS